MSDELMDGGYDDELEGNFLSGGTATSEDVIELEPEKGLEADVVLNPKPVKDGQPLLDFLRKNLHKFDSPHAYIGGEANSPDRGRFHTAEVKVLIARLSTYEATSLSMTHSLMAQIYQEEPYTFVDLTFLPKPDDYKLLRDNGFPVWFGTNSKLAPNKFDLLSISHPVAMEQLNFIPLLHDSGIPLFKQQRMEREDIPLIIVGGANAGTTAPLAGDFITDDGQRWSCFIDAAIYGEGEEAGKELVRVIREGKQKGWTKRQILGRCHGRVPGFYEPDWYAHYYDGHGRLMGIRPLRSDIEFPVKRATVIDLDKVRTLETKILPYSGDGMRVDVAIASGVGCVGSSAHGACTFCREGNEGPYRERSAALVQKALAEATKNQGCKEVSYFSLNFNSHKEFFPMVLESVRKGYKVGLISQRIDILAETPEQIRVQRWLGKSNYTLGIEGISQRLRNYLNKNLEEDQILKVIQVMMEEGAGELKLFYIVTGIEEQEDIDEWFEFTKKVEAKKAEGKWTTHFRISFTTLFPSASTPLMHAPALAAINHGTRSLDTIFARAKEIGWGRRLSVSGEEPLISNTINLGGRNITGLLLASHFCDGYRFYGGVAKGTWARWKARIANMPNVDLGILWGEKGEDYVFPWEDLGYASSRKALWEAYQRAKRFEAEPYCLTTQEKKGVCHWKNCGACDPLKLGRPEKAIIQNIVNRKVEPMIPVAEIERAARSREKAYCVRVLFETSDPLYRFVNKGYFMAAIPRALMKVSERFNWAFVGSIGHARTSAGANTMLDWTYGRNIYDFSLCEHLPESELKALIGPANLLIKEGMILDLRMNSGMKRIRSDVDFAIYSMFVPNGDKMSFGRIRSDIARYFERKQMGKSSKVKVKVTQGKGSFRTEERTLEGNDIRTVEYQWMPEFRGTLIRFVVTATYNPLAMLEAVTGRRSFQWKAFSIFCDGYVKLAEDTGETDVFAALLGEVTNCTECGGPLELDLFTGERHESGVCISCDLSVYPVNMNQFFTRELQAVHVG